MPLTAGARLGPYEIVSALGAGGMGEVYRARDARLGRDVAIKVLPAGLAGDPERLQRFEQEARAAAALNHSNILALYDIGTHDPSAGSGQAAAPYLVTELLEGATLRDQLTAPLPVRKAIEYAVQIAQGLAAAHEKGIVHRDLKPENIFVTDDGKVKILDFGLAKLVQPEPSAAGLTALPTTPPNTMAGMVLGTIGYMSPEQVRGVTADHRADIFAFGTVLYEMLSGRRAFQGETTMDTMTAIVKDHPPDLPAAERKIPPGLVRIIDRCLEKSPTARFQSTRDLAFALEALSSLSITSGAAEALGIKEQPRGRRTTWMIAASAIAGALAAAAGVLVWEGRAPASLLTGTPTRLSVTLPANRPIALGWTPGRSLALSPDGSQIVYVSANLDAPADRPGGRTQLQVRTLGALAVRDIPGTTDAAQPFFSPDGQWVGFFTFTGDLKKVSLAGGNPVTLLGKINASSYAFGTWTDDGAIIFGAPDAGAGLRRVPADGGDAVVLTTIDTAQGETAHVNPTVVPSTRALLFVAAYGQLRNPRIEALMLDTGERRVVLENAGASLWLPSGHLLFRRNDTFLIAPFDAARLTVTGPAVPLADDVGRDSLTIATPQPELAVSGNGTLAYMPAVTALRDLGLVNRSGSFERLGPPSASFVQPQVSPDGRSLAFVSIRGQESEVHVYDMVRGSTTNLTQDGMDAAPAWHPEGRSLAMVSRRKDTNAIFLRNLDGTERPLVTLPANATGFRQPSWSPDGKRLAYTLQTGSLHDIWVLTVGDTPAAQPFLASNASEFSPRFSPDGRWLAYVSDESGRPEIYIKGYPQGDRFAVSTAGGNGPVWSRDGKELFFQGPIDGVPKLMAVAVTPDKDALRLAKPVPLFDLRLSGPTGIVAQYAASINTGVAYDILPDGRFVMVRVAVPLPAREIVVVQHWFEELKGIVPGK